MVKSAQAQPIRIYLREIGEIDLLTRPEEIELAKRVAKGDEEARKQLIKANLRLVVKMARRYENLGLPLLDLIEEGNLGLIKAVDRYDLSRKCKFSTYAAWWIRQAILRALANQGKIIRIPVYMLEKVSAFHKNVERLRQKLGRPPSRDEISRELGLTYAEIDYFLELSRSPASLDAKIDAEGDSELSDVVPNATVTSPLDEMISGNLKSDMSDLMKHLSPREREIMEMRFGLVKGEGQTLEEIGKKFKISRERVRQIVNKAIANLREVIREQNMEFGDY